MRNARFVITNIWMWVIIVIACFISENFAFLTADPMKGFDPFTLALISFACIIALLVYFFLERKNNSFKFDKVLISIMAILFITFTIGIWIQKDATYVFKHAEGQMSAIVTPQAKFIATVILFFCFALTYIILHPLVLNKATPKAFLWMHRGMVIYVLITIIISIFMETGNYIKVFDDEYMVIKGFYLNENTFGLSVLLGLFSLFVLNINKRHFLHYLIGAGFLFELILIQCASTIILGFVSAAMFAIIDLILLMKKKPLLGIISVASAALALAIFAVIFVIGKINNWGFINWIVSVLDLLFAKNGGFLDMSSFESRIVIWKAFLKEITNSPLNIIFGHGYIVSEQYIRAISKSEFYMLDAPVPYDGVASCHNTILSIMFSFGAVGLIAFAALLFYFIYCAFKLFSHKKYFTFTFVHVIIVGLLLIYGLIETNIFFDVGTKETFVTLAFVMPIIVGYQRIKKPALTKEVKAMKEVKFDAKKVINIVSIVIISLIGALMTGLMNAYSAQNKELFMGLILSIAILIALLLVFPYALYLWIKDGDSFKRKYSVAINIIALLFVGILSFLLFYRNDNRLYIALLSTAIFLVLDVIIYSLVRKDFFRNYIVVTFINPVKVAFIPFVVSFTIIAIPSLMISIMIEFNMLTAFLMGIINLVVFYALISLIPNTQTKELELFLNEEMLYRENRLMKEGEYYGG